MQFTYPTLASTFGRFDASLKARGLKLPAHTSRNVWSQIVLGKNYSAAAAHTRTRGAVQAIPISEESIRSQLRFRSREVDIPTAYAIFVEAVGPDLGQLSQAMQELIDIVRLGPQLCVMSVIGDRAGLGLLDSHNPGYLPVSEFEGIPFTDNDIAWLRSSSQLAADTINALGGKSSRQFFDIFIANKKASDRKSDQVFGEYFGARIEPTGTALAQALLEEFDPSSITDWDLDFDAVHLAIFDVFERACWNEASWLRPDCAQAETLIDHLAVRLRETLTWMMEQAANGEPDDAPLETLAHSARIAMQKVLAPYLP